MDDLDCRIVRELTQGGHEGIAWGELNPSYRGIAGKFGVSRETIRDRIEKMSRSGFLKVFPVQVNPSLLGLSIGALSVDVPQSARKGELLAKLQMIDGMLLAATHVTNMIGVSFYYEDDSARDRKIGLIARICNGSNLKFTNVSIPRCNIRLSTRDWQIVSALQSRRTGPASEIAAELGISMRTLKRRTKRMIEGLAIATFVSSDEGALTGGVLGNLTVEYKSPESRNETDAELLKVLDPKLIYAGLWESFSVFTLFLPSITAASETLERIRKITGVAQARLDLIEDRVEVYSTLAERVKRKLKEVSTVAS